MRKGGFFSFEMKVQTGAPVALLCTYIGDDKDRSFDILVDDNIIASETLTGGTTGKFYDKVYDIPAQLIAGKTKVIVRIQSTNGKTAGRVFWVSNHQEIVMV